MSASDCCSLTVQLLLISHVLEGNILNIAACTGTSVHYFCKSYFCTAWGGADIALIGVARQLINCLKGFKNKQGI